VTNNAYGALADLSEDEISPSSNTRHGTKLGTYPSGDAIAPATFRSGPATPFVFGTDPASVHDDALRIALSRHLTDRFTFMNGRIKGFTQNLKDAEGRHAEFRRQTNNHLNAMRADDMDARRTERERFLWMENTLKTLLQQTDTYNRANEALLEAQHASRAETTLLRAEIETLTRKLEDYTATPPPLHPPSQRAVPPPWRKCPFSFTEYNRASRTSWTWYATPRERGNAYRTANTTTPNRNPPQHADNYRKNDATYHRPTD
jgi:hypothetical protein